MDALTEIQAKEKTSGLSAILSEPDFVSAGLIPFVNEEDFRSPLVVACLHLLLKILS
jgi:preprotein translocase subunit Sec61beta